MICHAYYGFTLSIASEIILGVNSLDKKIHKYFDGVVVDNKNRKYKYENIPRDFDSTLYIELNEDLKNLTKIEAKIHYEVIGYKKNTLS